jgi:hypothetical protein
MVEVFKTDVNEAEHARILLHEINLRFNDYEVNFDLEDCDRILRVKSPAGVIESIEVIALLKGYGYTAEILPEVDAPATPVIGFPLYNMFNTLHS